ncbi:GL14680 [Drosophila persimilis]|uniref:GL14680 n=1 Tax=Drosophila persimilis TaxID=7234 RepID=B4GVM2_DROPE|nr:GL14680 [Drosophila persimilis]
MAADLDGQHDCLWNTCLAEYQNVEMKQPPDCRFCPQQDQCHAQASVDRVSDVSWRR